VAFSLPHLFRHIIALTVALLSPVCASLGLPVTAARADTAATETPVCVGEPEVLKAWEKSWDGVLWEKTSSLLNPTGRDGRTEVRFRHALAPHGCSGWNLFVRTVDEELEVRMDDTVIAHYKTEPHAFGYPWLLVPLPPLPKGANLELVVRTNGTHLGITALPITGTSESLIARIVALDFPSTILGTLFVLLALGAGTLSLLRKTHLIVATYGLFVGVLGIYTLSNMRLRQLIGGTPSVWLVVEYTSLFLLPATAFLFFETFLPRRGIWRARPQLWASALFFVVAVAVGVTNGPHAYAEMLTHFSAVFVALALTFALRLISEWRLQRGPLLRAFVMGSSVLLLSAVLDVFAGWGIIPVEAGFLKYGNLVFVSVVSWQVVRLSIEKYRQEFENEISLRHQRTLSEAGRLSALGEMAGSIAHEINNPLAIIVGKSQHIAINLSSASPDTPRALNDVDRILKAAQRLSRTVHAMRTLGRDSAGEEMERIAARAVVRQVLDLCQERIVRSGIHLDTRFTEPDLQVLCRPTQVGQVLLNLLNNAVDALEDRAGAEIILACEHEKSRVLFRVTDNGPGVPEEIATKIFAPFYTTKPAGKGTGLGLSLSRRIVEAHGGTLSYERENDLTHFLVTLPV